MPNRPPVHRPSGRVSDASSVITDERRRQDHRFYNSARWRKLRALRLSINPLCQDCEEHGEVTAAEQVDHVLPRHERPDLELELENTRSLCPSHHSSKTRRDQRRGERVSTDMV